LSILIFQPDQQASGQFDEGRLVEQKPIGFPGEGSEVTRVGTLFYWAWFQAKKDAYLPPHPHRGFEIISYLLKGRVHHQDTLGNEKSLGPGGLQVMQTGSGVQHSEKYEEGTSGFQIWFEPFVGVSNYATPTYADYQEQDFPVSVKNGVTVKTILGENSPAHLVADSTMWDVTISSGQKFECKIPTGYSIAGLVVEGRSNWDFENQRRSVETGVFVVCEATTDTALLSIETDTEETRLILIQVPRVLPYPSYKNVKKQSTK
jgi:redox-sensitive bicupin YhaK (pirin superfamily)